MRVPAEVRARHASDVDVELFLDHFDMPEGSRVLCVGCHDESTANMLAECGFRVTGVDLREYRTDEGAPCNYTYLRCDFCAMDRLDFYHPEHWEPFDAFVSLSAIEHFGLGTYGEGRYHPYYDVIAMRKAWELLREGGRAYVTVPYGGAFIENCPHWRVYDKHALLGRIVQDFRPLGVEPRIAAALTINGERRDVGDPLSMGEANAFSGDPPHVSLLAVLEKEAQSRLAPDGR